MTVDDVSWDLSPLVHGEDDAGADRLLDEAADARAGVRRGPRRPRRRARGARVRRGRARAAGDLRARRARRQLRDAALQRRHRRPGDRRAHAARAGEEHGDRDAAALLRARVGRARRRARRGAAARRRPRHRPPLPALRAPLPPAPALRARGEDPRREVRHRRLGLGRACSASTSRRSTVDLPGDGRARHARRRARAASCPPTARCAAAPPRPSPRRSQPGPAHARVHLQHAPARQGRRRPPAQLPELARRPQPLQRGLRRVRPGAADAPCATATSCRAAGIASRRSCSASTGSPTTTAWPPSRRTTSPSTGRTPRSSCSTPTPRFSPELGDPARAFFDEHRIDAPPRPAKRGGAFCAYTVPSEHPYLMLNYTAKRRDVLDPRARAGPRPARRARPPARRPRAAHAADARRDGVGVRRDARLPPPARAGRRRPSRACRCSPSRSRARSRRSSARPR